MAFFIKTDDLIIETDDLLKGGTRTPKAPKIDLGEVEGVKVVAIGPKGGLILGWDNKGAPIYASSSKGKLFIALKQTKKKASEVGTWLKALGMSGAQFDTKAGTVAVTESDGKLLGKSFDLKGTKKGNALVFKLDSLIEHVGKPLIPKDEKLAGAVALEATGDKEFFPDLSDPSSFEWLSGAELNKVISGGSHGGIKALKDKNGKYWVFKTQDDTIARAEEGALRLQRLVAGNLVPAAKYMKVGGTPGVLIEWRPGPLIGASGSPHPVPKKDTKKFATEMAMHQVADFLTFQHDAHGGNFIVQGNHLIGFDKGQAWKHVGKDKLDPNWKPPENPSPTVYKQLWQMVKDGEIPVEDVVKGFSQAIANAATITPEQYKIIAAPYLGAAAEEFGWDDSIIQQKLKAMVKRLETLKSQFEKLIEDQTGLKITIPMPGDDNFETMPDVKVQTPVGEPAGAVKPGPKVETDTVEKVKEAPKPVVLVPAAGWPKTSKNGLITIHHPGDAPKEDGPAIWPKGYPGPGFKASMKYGAKGKEKGTYTVEFIQNPDTGAIIVRMTYPDQSMQDWDSPAKAADSMKLFATGYPLATNATKKKELGIAYPASKAFGIKEFKDDLTAALDPSAKPAPETQSVKELEESGTVTPEQDTLPANVGLPDDYLVGATNAAPTLFAGVIDEEGVSSKLATLPEGTELVVYGEMGDPIPVTKTESEAEGAKWGGGPTWKSPNQDYSQYKLASMVLASLTEGDPVWWKPVPETQTEPTLSEDVAGFDFDWKWGFGGKPEATPEELSALPTGAQLSWQDKDSGPGFRAEKVGADEWNLFTDAGTFDSKLTGAEIFAMVGPGGHTGTVGVWTPAPEPEAPPVADPWGPEAVAELLQPKASGEIKFFNSPDASEWLESLPVGTTVEYVYDMAAAVGDPVPTTFVATKESDGWYEKEKDSALIASPAEALAADLSSLSTKSIKIVGGPTQETPPAEAPSNWETIPEMESISTWEGFSGLLKKYPVGQQIQFWDPDLKKMVVITKATELLWDHPEVSLGSVTIAMKMAESQNAGKPTPKAPKPGTPGSGKPATPSLPNWDTMPIDVSAGQKVHNIKAALPQLKALPVGAKIAFISPTGAVWTATKQDDELQPWKLEGVGHPHDYPGHLWLAKTLVDVKMDTGKDPVVFKPAATTISDDIKDPSAGDIFTPSEMHPDAAMALMENLPDGLAIVTKAFDGSVSTLWKHPTKSATHMINKEGFQVNKAAVVGMLGAEGAVIAEKSTPTLAGGTAEPPAGWTPWAPPTSEPGLLQDMLSLADPGTQISYKDDTGDTLIVTKKHNGKWEMYFIEGNSIIYDNAPTKLLANDLVDGTGHLKASEPATVLPSGGSLGGPGEPKPTTLADDHFPDVIAANDALSPLPAGTKIEIELANSTSTIWKKVSDGKSQWVDVKTHEATLDHNELLSKVTVDYVEQVLSYPPGTIVPGEKSPSEENKAAVVDALEKVPIGATIAVPAPGGGIKTFHKKGPNEWIGLAEDLSTVKLAALVEPVGFTIQEEEAPAEQATEQAAGTWKLLTTLTESNALAIVKALPEGSKFRYFDPDYKKFVIATKLSSGSWSLVAAIAGELEEGVTTGSSLQNTLAKDLLASKNDHNVTPELWQGGTPSEGQAPVWKEISQPSYVLLAEAPVGTALRFLDQDEDPVLYIKREDGNWDWFLNWQGGELPKHSSPFTPKDTHFLAVVAEDGSGFQISEPGAVSAPNWETMPEGQLTETKTYADLPVGTKLKWGPKKTTYVKQTEYGKWVDEADPDNVSKWQDNIDLASAVVSGAEVLLPSGETVPPALVEMSLEDALKSHPVVQGIGKNFKLLKVKGKPTLTNIIINNEDDAIVQLQQLIDDLGIADDIIQTNKQPKLSPKGTGAFVTLDTAKLKDKKVKVPQSQAQALAAKPKKKKPAMTQAQKAALEQKQAELEAKKKELEEKKKQAQEVAAWAKDKPPVTAQGALYVLSHLQQEVGSDVGIYARKASAGSKKLILIGSEDPDFLAKLEKLGLKEGKGLTAVDSPLGVPMFKVNIDALQKALPQSGTIKGPDGKEYPKGTTFEQKTVTTPVKDLLPHEPGFSKTKDHKTEPDKAVIKVASNGETQKQQMLDLLKKYDLEFTNAAGAPGELTVDQNVVVVVDKKALEKVGKGEVITEAVEPEKPPQFVARSLPSFGVGGNWEEVPPNAGDLALAPAMDLKVFGHAIRMGKAGIFRDGHVNVRKVTDSKGKVFFEIQGTLAKGLPSSNSLSSGEMKLRKAQKVESFGVFDVEVPNILNDGSVKEKGILYKIPGKEGVTEGGSTIEVATDTGSKVTFNNAFAVRVPEGEDLQTEFAAALTAMGFDLDEAMAEQTVADERIMKKWGIVRSFMGAKGFNEQLMGDPKNRIYDETWLDAQIEGLAKGTFTPDGSLSGTPSGHYSSGVQVPNIYELVETATIRRTAAGHLTVVIEDEKDAERFKGIKFLKRDEMYAAEMTPKEAGDRIFSILSTSPEGSELHARRNINMHGIGSVGGSVSDDISNGGASGTFFYASDSDAASQYHWIVNPRATSRTDWWSYPGDGWGNIAGKGKGASHLGSMNRGDFQGNNSPHEIMHEGGFALEDMMAVTVPEPKRGQMIAELKKKGVEEINGVPVEDFIITPGGNIINRIHPDLRPTGVWKQ